MPKLSKSGMARRSKSQRAGLTFNVARIARKIRKERVAPRTTVAAAVYLAATVEYLVAELVELSTIKAKEGKRRRIRPRDVMLACRADSELNEYTRNVVFAWSGNRPNIHPALISKGRIIEPPTVLVVEEEEEEEKKEEEEEKKEEKVKEKEKEKEKEIEIEEEEDEKELNIVEDKEDEKAAEPAVTEAAVKKKKKAKKLAKKLTKKLTLKGKKTEEKPADTGATVSGGIEPIKKKITRSMSKKT